jgi:hypothetical protein
LDGETFSPLVFNVDSILSNSFLLGKGSEVVVTVGDGLGAGGVDAGGGEGFVGCGGGVVVVVVVVVVEDSFLVGCFYKVKYLC